MEGEFVLDTHVVRAFVSDVEQAIAGSSSPEAACDAIRPRFSELLADPDWLPEAFRADAPKSGMGTRRATIVASAGITGWHE